jgi:hypothetical protein
MVRVLYLRRPIFGEGGYQVLSQALWVLAELCSEQSHTSTMVDLVISLNQETLNYRSTLRRST